MKVGELVHLDDIFNMKFMLTLVKYLAFKLFNGISRAYAGIRLFRAK